MVGRAALFNIFLRPLVDLSAAVSSALLMNECQFLDIWSLLFLVDDGTLLLQVILYSQVNASVIVYDAWLDLQDGFSHTRKGDTRPISAYFPLTISIKSRAAILFGVNVENTVTRDQVEALYPESILNVHYEISGSRNLGAHTPMNLEPMGSDGAVKPLDFSNALVLQRPVLDPCLAVGFLPLPSSRLRVG